MGIFLCVCASQRGEHLRLTIQFILQFIASKREAKQTVAIHARDRHQQLIHALPGERRAAINITTAQVQRACKFVILDHEAHAAGARNRIRQRGGASSHQSQDPRVA